MFQIPPATPYDLRFNLLGISVRVHPIFWLIGLLLGSSGGIVGAVIWVAVLFISIVVHEVGHVLAMRRYGGDGRIILYGAGGLAVPTGGRNRTPQEGIVVSFAGPLAGFILAAILLATVFLLGGTVRYFPILGFIPFFGAYLPAAGAIGNQIIGALLQFNIFWGLINLLPVFPLDGGHISRYMFVISDPWGGVQKSLWLSLIVGGTMAVIGLALMDSIFIALLFGMLAFQSYQMLQGGGGGRF